MLVTQKTSDSGTLLEVRSLYVKAQSRLILKDINLSIKPGEIHAIMGRNGSGKSTLANALMGNPGYEVASGDILFHGESIVGLKPEERAKMGLFLAFQSPIALPGVPVSTFLRAALRATKPEHWSARESRKVIQTALQEFGLGAATTSRYVNDGFSGGEKKRFEIAQMLLLKPKLAILDEPDSGLDVDGLKTVAASIEKVVTQGTAVLLITHYERLLSHVRPDRVHVLLNGQIVQTGGPDLAKTIEAQGYENFENTFAFEG